MRWNEEERRGGVRAIAVCRVVAVPVFLAVCLLHDDDTSVGPLLALSAASLVFTIVGMVMLLGERWQRAPLPAFLVGDALAIAGAIALSGGADSDARFVGPLVLVGVAVVVPRSLSVWHSLGLTAACAVPVLALPGEESAGTFFVASAFAALLAYAVSRAIDETNGRLRAVAGERRTLLTTALEVEQGARLALAQDVHDRALQTMLAARQDLEEASLGAEDALASGRRGLDVAIVAVRDAVHELHAGALTGCLPHSLHALMERTATMHRVEARAIVNAGSGVHDELLYAVARQLVADAAQRSGTTQVSVELRAADGAVELEVRDDGVASGRRFSGLALATSAERIAAAGGRLQVRRTTAGATR